MKREIYRIIFNKTINNNGIPYCDDLKIVPEPAKIGKHDFLLKKIIYSNDKYYLEYWNGHYMVISDDRVQVFIRPIEEDGTTQNKVK